jgi:hypothetical protein
MAVELVTAGQAFQASVQFTDDFGDDVAASGTVRYRVMDPNMRLVVQGAASVDSVNASLYVATITLPSSVPPTEPGQAYTIQWRMKGVDGERYTVNDQFRVTAYDLDPDSYYPKDVVIIPGSGFVDRIKMQKTATPPDVIYSIITETGMTLATKTPVMTEVGGYYSFTVKFTKEEAASLGVPTGVQQHYIGNWRVTDDLDFDEVESRPVYVLTPQAQTIVHAMYKMLSEGVVQNIEPYTTATVGTYLHHAIKGFAKVNGMPPRSTAFSINAPFPVGLIDLIEKAGMVSYLQSLLASVNSNWEFQGAGVQLNVDRTTSVQSMIDQFNQDLEKGPDIKKAWFNSGQPLQTTAAANSSKMPILTRHMTVGAYTNIAITGIPHEAIAPSYLTLSQNVFTSRGGGKKL